MPLAQRARAGSWYQAAIGAKTMRILLSAFAVAPLTGPRFFLPRTVVVGAAAARAAARRDGAQKAAAASLPRRLRARASSPGAGGGGGSSTLEVMRAV